MDDRMVESLVERVGRLERQNRTLKRLGGAGLAVAFLAVAIGAALDDDVVRCRFLEVTGPRGESRIRLVAGNTDDFNGRVTIEVLDPQGRKASEMYWDPNRRSGRFVVYSNDGSGREFRSIP